MKKISKKGLFGEAEKFYSQALSILNKNQVPYLIGGTFAMQIYLDMNRDTNDMDIFARSSDALKILKVLGEAGFKAELPDARWIGKVYFRNFLIDIIFDTSQGLTPVDNSWFKYPYPAELFGQKIHLVPPEEMIWSKAYRQDRFRYEGPDINHLILKLGHKLDWKRILSRMEPHWEVLFAHLINFRFVYPSERDIIPRWLIDEFIRRLHLQFTTPHPQTKVCRGPLLAIDPYKIDVLEWGFKDIF